MSSLGKPRELLLGQAVELFKTEFRKRYPESEFLIDGATRTRTWTSTSTLLVTSSNWSSTPSR